MTDSFLQLSDDDRREVLEIAADASGRPSHLLEKDVWVVFALQALFDSALHEKLVFKGGTSLSKAYGAIDRFSEDVDLTYDIREAADDLLKGGSPIPATKSQASKWTKEIRHRLPGIVSDEIAPVLERAVRAGVGAQMRIDEDKLYLEYDPLFEGTGYVLPRVLLEFGARSTGEPNETIVIACDAARHHPAIGFPTASARVMGAERTWWEKATAIHVFCHKGSFGKTERYARHWYDIIALDRTGHAERAIADAALSANVAAHKTRFFEERHDGAVISYGAAVTGALRLVPDGPALARLEQDYRLMVEDGLFLDVAPAFDELMRRCSELEQKANALLKDAPSPPSRSRF